MSELAKQIIPTDVYNAYTPIANPDEFLAGMRDCKNGIGHKMGMGEEYTRGYAAQYQAELNRRIYG